MTKILDNIAFFGLSLIAIATLLICAGLAGALMLQAGYFGVGFFAFVAFTVWATIRIDSMEYFFRNRK